MTVKNERYDDSNYVDSYPVTMRTAFYQNDC
jgi:hypothetical protein